MELIFISNFKNEKFISAFKTALEEFSIDLSKLGTYIEEFNAAGDIYAYVLLNEKGESIGMIQFQKTVLSNELLNEEYGLIREFWIAPEHRKQGCGSLLLKKAESYFVENNLCYSILSSREEAVDFYRKNGYTKKENARSFNGMIVLEKELKHNE